MFFDNNLKKHNIYKIFKGEKMLRLLMLAGFLFACEGETAKATPPSQTTEGADDNNTTSNDNQKNATPVANTKAVTTPAAETTTQVADTPTESVDQTQTTDKGNE